MGQGWGDCTACDHRSDVSEWFPLLGKLGNEFSSVLGRKRRIRVNTAISGERSGNLLQCSCLENSMDRRAWRATVCRVAKSQTCLSD